MKAKRINIIVLSILAIFVWGIAFFRIFGILNSIEEDVIALPVINKNANAKNIDTFSINLDHFDPFLQNEKPMKFKSDQSGKTPQFKSEIKKTSLQPEVNQNIQFLGLIKKSKSENVVALISINGVIGNFKQGDKYDGVEVLKIYRDSILIITNNNKFFVRK